jgi:hypothetical protein
MVLAMATAAPASARKSGKSPVLKGGVYAGTLAAPRTAFVISFEVSKNGKQVRVLKLNNLPFYCPGGGKPVPIAFKNATISKAFTFTSTGVQTIKVGPKKGQTGATLKITGKFTTGRAEAGRITTTFPAAVGTSCNGTSSYSTKAA